MTKFAFPLAAAAVALSMGTAAFASVHNDTRTFAGTVEGYFPKINAISMNDGRTFYLPFGYHNPQLHVGSKVVFIWEKTPDAQGNQHTFQIRNIDVKS